MPILTSRCGVAVDIQNVAGCQPPLHSALDASTGPLSSLTVSTATTLRVVTRYSFGPALNTPNDQVALGVQGRAGSRNWIALSSTVPGGNVVSMAAA